jgi:hypothetical protein
VVSVHAAVQEYRELSIRQIAQHEPTSELRSNDFTFSIRHADDRLDM